MKIIKEMIKRIWLEICIPLLLVGGSVLFALYISELLISLVLF
jgi:hypothetical protein